MNTENPIHQIVINFWQENTTSYILRLFITLILFINVFGFFLMAYDKRQAKNQKWRVPEARFFLIALIGGSAGLILGMRVFRHKTKHRSFTYGLPITLCTNLIVLYLAYKYVYLPYFS